MREVKAGGDGSPGEDMPAGSPSETVSRYLEAVYYMQSEGEAVRASRLAEWLGVSQPTASATLHRMVRDELVQISEMKVIHLTPFGREMAERVVRRHRIAERWLTDVLGLDWLEADEEAGRLEHALSDRVADRLFELLGRPETCPHGNPIPGASRDLLGERALSTLGRGETARLTRISEVAEHEAPQLLTFMSDSGFRIGSDVTMVGASPGAGVLKVEVGGREVAMSFDVAEKIWVEDRAATSRSGRAEGAEATA